MNYKIVPLDNEEIPHLNRLLNENQLPTSDISDKKAIKFWIIKEAEQIISAIGLEIYGQNALLRSLVVSNDFRNKNMAKSMILFVEAFAERQNVNEIYLLTTTARAFFEKLAYNIVQRSKAPKEISNTSEFSMLCPESAAFMYKKLIPND